MFEFKGDWETVVKLPKLSKLDDDRYFKYKTYEKHRGLLSASLIPLEIQDEHTNAPDPLPEQIAGINWISENESSILISLYDCIINTVFPHYKEVWDDDWDEEEEEHMYPKMSGVEELKKAIGIKQIRIHTENRNGTSYYTILFSFCTDEEHGIGITMHEDRIIAHAPLGDIDHKGIIKDLGLDYQEWHNEKLQEQQKQKIFYSPHSKYGNLKPWQKSANNFYPYHLLHSDKLAEFKEHIKIGRAPVDGISSSFLRIAINRGKGPFIDYLLSQDLTKLHEPFMEALRKKRIDLLDRIIEKGYDVNSKVARYSPLYYLIDVLLAAEKDSEKEKNTKKMIEYLLSNGLNPYIQKDGFNENSLSRLQHTRHKDAKINSSVKN